MCRSVRAPHAPAFTRPSWCSRSVPRGDGTVGRLRVAGDCRPCFVFSPLPAQLWAAGSGRGCSFEPYRRVSRTRGLSRCSPSPMLVIGVPGGHWGYLGALGDITLLAPCLVACRPRLFPMEAKALPRRLPCALLPSEDAPGPRCVSGAFFFLPSFFSASP